MSGRKNAIENGLDTEKLIKDYQKGFSWKQAGERQNVSRSTAHKYGSSLIASRSREEANRIKAYERWDRERIAQRSPH